MGHLAVDVEGRPGTITEEVEAGRRGWKLHTMEVPQSPSQVALDGASLVFLLPVSLCASGPAAAWRRNAAKVPNVKLRSRRLVRRRRLHFEQPLRRADVLQVWLRRCAAAVARAAAADAKQDARADGLVMLDRACCAVRQLHRRPERVQPLQRYPAAESASGNHTFHWVRRNAGSSGSYMPR